MKKPARGETLRVRPSEIPRRTRQRNHNAPLGSRQARRTSSGSTRNVDIAPCWAKTPPVVTLRGRTVIVFPSIIRSSKGQAGRFSHCRGSNHARPRVRVSPLRRSGETLEELVLPAPVGVTAPFRLRGKRALIVPTPFVPLMADGVGAYSPVRS